MSGGCKHHGKVTSHGGSCRCGYYSAKPEEEKGEVINSYVLQEPEDEGSRSSTVKQLVMAVLLTWFLVAAVAVKGSSLTPRTSSNDHLASCPGYKASNVKTTASSLTADLSLAGAACNVYGDDLTSLTLEVVYETGESPITCGHHKIS
jgi:hypothetical protein